jgi:Rrf2 family protein
MISTKGRYAIRFMIDLAEQQDGSPVPLEDVASRQNISKKYLETVVNYLVKAKLVKGASGKGGGYRLLRRPADYTVGEILMITEGSLATVACLNKDSDICPRGTFCKTLPMWKKYDSMVHDFFYNITIEDLVNGNI